MRLKKGLTTYTAVPLWCPVCGKVVPSNECGYLWHEHGGSYWMPVQKKELKKFMKTGVYVSKEETLRE